MMSWRFCAWIAVFSLVTFTLGAVVAQPSAVEDEDARALFELGENAFETGRYAAALDYFQQAYDHSLRPELLYNIGQTADRLRLDERALAAFEQYLRDVPDAENAPAVNARIAILRRAVAEHRPAVAPEVPPPIVPPAVETPMPAETSPPSDVPTAATVPATATPEPTLEAASSDVVAPSAAAEATSRHGRAGVGVAGLGATVLALGVTFTALAAHDTRTVEGAPQSSDWSSVASAYDRASTRFAVGYALIGIGVAAGATGLVLALRDGSTEATTVSLRVRPGGLALEGSF